MLIVLDGCLLTQLSAWFTMAVDHFFPVTDYVDDVERQRPMTDDGWSVVNLFRRRGKPVCFRPLHLQSAQYVCVCVCVCVCLVLSFRTVSLSPFLSFVDHHHLPTVVFLFWTRIFYYARLSNSHFYYALMMLERCAVVSAYIGLC